MRHLWTIAIAALPLSACHAHQGAGESATATGTGTSRTYQVADFTGVELRGSDDVDVAVGGSFAVRAEGPAELLDKLQIVKQGNTLSIGRKDGISSMLALGKSAHVYVTMPRLSAAVVSGSGDMAVDRTDGDISAAVDGSGTLKVGKLDAGKADLSVSGSGELSAAGTAKALQANLAGSGVIDAKGLKASSGRVSITGSGDLYATVAGPVDISLVGSGDADIRGGAQCHVNRIGSGEAHCS